MNDERIRTFFSPENRRMHLCIIAGLCLVTFCRSLMNGFVWDDTVFFIGRSPYNNFDLKGIFLTLANDVEYLPVRDLSIAIDHLLWGITPAGFHAVNLLIHTATSCLLYLCVTKIVALADSEDQQNAACRLIPLGAALLFAVHPLQAQSVNFITCRNTLLSGLFSILAIKLYLNSTESPERLKHQQYAGAILSFAAAMLSKAASIVVPPLLILLLLLPEHRKALKRNLLAGAPFWGIAAGFYLLHIKIAEHANIVDPSQANSLAGKISIAVQIPWFYIGKFLLPITYSPEYDTRFALFLTKPVVLTAIVGVIILCSVILLTRRRSPLLSFGIAWYLVALAPVLNFFATNPVVADRYAYLPIIGLAIASSSLLELLSLRFSRVAVPAASVLLLLLSLLSWRETGAWKSNFTLWEHGIENSPKNGKNYSNLAVNYINRKEYDKAFPLLLKLKDLDFLWDYHSYYTAVLYREKGNLPEAVKALQRAIDANDRFDKAHLLLGELYEEMGDYEMAYIHYSTGLPLLTTSEKKDRIPAEKARERIIGKIRSNLDRMRSAANAAPNDIRLRGELALKLDRLMFYDEALKEYRELERIGMKGWQLQYNIGNVLMKLKRMNEAEQAFQACIALDRNNKDAYNNLGILLKERKEYSSAIAAFRQAIAIDPGFSMARFNMLSAYYKMGERNEAERLARELVAAFPEMKQRVAILLEP